MKKVRIIKVDDRIFNGSHPNNINEGYTKVGYLDENLKEGESLYLYNKDGLPLFRTSTIQSIVSKELIQTKNSYYKIEYLDE